MFLLRFQNLLVCLYHSLVYMWLYLVLFIAVRTAVVLWQHRGRPYLSRPRGGSRKFKILVVLGSGGHTTEMLRLLKPVVRAKADRLDVVFVVAASDHTSVPRIASILGVEFRFQLATVPRLRNVGESVTTALLRVPITLISALRVIWSSNPDVIITNGPGTCFPLIFASLILEFLFIQARPVRIFVESFCRVTTISTTGKLAYRLVDSFILQWKPSPELAARYPRAKFLGVLI